MASFEDFQKLDLRVGEIKEIKRIAGSDKLLELKVDLGEKTLTIVAGIAKDYPEPNELTGKQIVIVANLEPKTIRGLKSEGMVLGAEDEDRYYLLQPDKPVKAGSKVL